MNNEEKFWIHDLGVLLKPINFIPYGDLFSGSRLNAITRLIIVIYIIMVLCKYKYSTTFLVVSLTFVVAVYFCQKGNFEKVRITKENFETLSYDNNKMNKSLQSPNGTSYMEKKMKDALKYNNRNYNTIHNYGSINDNLDQDTLNPSVMLPATHRDPEAGIQYYTPNQGINRNMYIEPLIAPRSLDPEVWAFPSTYPSGMNAHNIQEVTLNNNFPNGVNNYEMYNKGEVDYRRDTRRVYANEGYWESDIQGIVEDPMVTLEKEYQMKKQEIIKSYKETKAKEMDEEQAIRKENDRELLVKDALDYFRKEKEEKNKKNISTKYINPTENLEKMSSELYKNNTIPKSNQDYYDLNQTSTPDQVYGKSRVSSIQSVLNKGKTGNYMLEPSPTYTYTDEYFAQPERRLFLQDIQPNIYSYSVEQTPVNANIGISYTPQIPPKFRDSVYTKNNNYPIYTRVDPQLVRDDGQTLGQLQQEPERGPWSAKYSSWNPPAGSINFEDIYDPRFTSYGDPYRSYTDINLGQVQYYYSDIDAYKRPNFIIRSNVDFVEYQDPMGRDKTYYDRTASLEDVKDVVQNRYDADDLYHREDLMASQMAKRNAEEWQLKMAPLSQRNNTHHSTWGPGV